MAQQQNILILCGSLRQGSFNRKLANSAQELAPPNMRFSEAPPIGDIPHYNADVQNSEGFPPQVVALAEAVAAADGVLIVSPEYNFSVPGVLKNAIDWVSRQPEQPFRGKPVALQSAAGGLLGGARSQYHMRQIMVFLEAQVFTKPEVFVTFAAKKFDEGTGRLSDEATRDAVAAQLKAFSDFVARMNG
ncbi:NADPH-dependent FMN reductase [Alkalilacustris brevis]|uniref:NADPH-dependent FMN reductase n=1 Tax=Alkalilacustris brevis TaxID=2026338 RepID=UPI000E0CC62D|nr:NADPH-dependent FMN reductase [Alkalilacustris brevis]